MDPNSGKLYESVEEAQADGVEHPVELQGRWEDVEAISEAVKAAARKKARQQQKASRKTNRIVAERKKSHKR